MPVQVWVPVGGVVRKYFTNVLHFNSPSVVTEDADSGAVTVTPDKDPRIILITIDGQPDTEIGPGHMAKVLPLKVPGTLVEIRVTTDINTTMTINVWRDSIANGDPTVADDVTGGNPITLTAAKFLLITAFGSWDTSVAADDIWLFTIATIGVGVKFIQIELVIQT